MSFKAGEWFSFATFSADASDAWDRVVLLNVGSEGWPHLSFYADGGSIGGVYFGQGDSLLKVMPWKKANS